MTTDGKPAGGLLCELSADGSQPGRRVTATDLGRAVADYERSGDGSIRWVWPSGADLYPALLRAGVRVARCHDVPPAERLLLGRDGRAEEPASLAAADARLRGGPVPAGPAPGPVRQ